MALLCALAFALLSPATGDNFPVKALIIAGVIALVLIILTVITKNKKGDN